MRFEFFWEESDQQLLDFKTYKGLEPLKRKSESLSKGEFAAFSHIFFNHLEAIFSLREYLNPCSGKKPHYHKFEIIDWRAEAVVQGAKELVCFE